jgi:hypothetical protein
LTREISILDQKLAQLPMPAEYPLGKDLGLPGPLDRFSDWTNVPPTPVLFLSYLGELRQAGAAGNDWVKGWTELSKSDNEAALRMKLQNLNDLWMQNVPAAASNADFRNYFYSTWQRLNEIETTWQTRQRVYEDMVKAADVGLFIIDPKHLISDPRQPGRDVEVFRFDLP